MHIEEAEEGLRTCPMSAKVATDEKRVIASVQDLLQGCQHQLFCDGPPWVGASLGHAKVLQFYLLILHEILSVARRETQANQWCQDSEHALTQTGEWEWERECR